MKNTFLAVVAGLLLLVSFGGAGHAALRVMTESFPPLNYTADGKVQGAAVELMQQALQRMGRGAEGDSVELMPWARAYSILMKEPGAMLFSTARTDAREELFKWAGPIMKMKIAVLAPKSSKLKIKEVSELDRLVVGTVRDGAPAQLLLKAGLNPSAMDISGNSLSNVKKLNSGRIDVCAIPLPVAHYLMKQEGIDPDSFENIYTLKEVGLYYAFNKDTDDTIFAEFQRSFDLLSTAGAGGKSIRDSIFERYIGSSD